MKKQQRARSKKTAVLGGRAHGGRGSSVQFSKGDWDWTGVPTAFWSMADLGPLAAWQGRVLASLKGRDSARDGEGALETSLKFGAGWYQAQNGLDCDGFSANNW